jgi:ABC-type polysaccharide/polyol phosphate transport system ATPase subunit
MTITRNEFPMEVGFSELAEFIDTPVKNYSSGMRARLGYAIAAHLEPDILLLDEALAVGDPPFRRKCLQHLLQLRKQGTTLIVVAHDFHTIKSVCDRCINLERGEIVFFRQHSGGAQLFKMHQTSLQQKQN